jgi:hypothetical protein
VHSPQARNRPEAICRYPGILGIKLSIGHPMSSITQTGARIQDALNVLRNLAKLLVEP